MLLSEVIGADWPYNQHAGDNKLELTRLQDGADEDLLGSLYTDEEVNWTITFNGHFLNAIVSHVIIKGIANKIVDDKHIKDFGWQNNKNFKEIDIKLNKLWFCPEENILYGSAPVSVPASVSAIKDYVCKFVVDKKITFKPDIHYGPYLGLIRTHPSDVNLMLCFLAGKKYVQFFFPTDQLDADHSRDA